MEPPESLKADPKPFQFTAVQAGPQPESRKPLVADVMEAVERLGPDAVEAKRVEIEADDNKRRGDAVKVLDIINARKLTADDVHIINPDSKFVVITYWWGTGNLNRNLKHPCDSIISEVKKDVEGWEDFKKQKEALEELPKGPEYDAAKAKYDEAINEEVAGELDVIYTKRAKNMVELYENNFGKLDEEAYNAMLEEQKGIIETVNPAVPYQDMIRNAWIPDCIKVNCNYLEVEYPEIASQRLYQAAINGKPAFIQKALEVCYPRAVVYIDGDMRMNVYPSIFDTEGIDFMARQWNIDPRAKENYLAKTEDGGYKTCFDPWNFETSGGIQYFGNTPGSKDLIDTWIYSNNMNPGKADDRIISLSFNVLRYAIPLNYIMLPIEYLWLTDLYFFHRVEDTGQERAICEHPACLTSEESAAEQGASANRNPYFYSELVEDLGECERAAGIFYEYIFFDTPEMVKTFQPWLNYFKDDIALNINGERLLNIVTYENLYGDLTPVAIENKKAANAKRETLVATDSVVLDTLDIPTVLAWLDLGTNVYFQPAGTTLDEIKTKDGLALQFIATNANPPSTTASGMDDYTPTFNLQKPMFFAHRSRVLKHLLTICKTAEDITSRFNSSFIFLTRIQCYWFR